MPIIDNEAARDARRVYLKSLHKGSFITAGLDMSKVAMSSGGRVLDCTPERSETQLEAERKAKAKAQADREWADRCWRLYAR